MTKSEALLEAIAPLRQADFSVVRETLEGINFPTPTTRIVKTTVYNLLAYLEIEKDLSPDFQLPPPIDPVLASAPDAPPKLRPKKKRRIKRAKK
jgi:hypothetical protein